MKHSYDVQRNLWTRPDFSGIAYSDGSEFEAHLLSVMQGAKDKSIFSNELATHIRDWPSEYHLTASRHCLMRPLPFTPGQSVLELGCGCGAITRYLGEMGLQVTAVEGGTKRAEITAERVRDLPNVKVVFDDLVQFQSSQQFDWVTLIGVLEYSPMFAPGDDPVSAYLKQALSYLKPGGRLVIAIENQLGLKYFNGCGEDHVGLPFYGPQGLYVPGGPVTFGKRQLRQRLLDVGFADVDFFYPFPDYKIPQAVVSERAFTAPGFKVADMLLRTAARDYTGRPLRLFSEQLVARELEDNGVLSDFANSFLLIARQNDVAPTDQAAPIAWCFSMNRRDSYKTETTFHLNGETIEVRKAPATPSISTAPPTKLLHHVGAAAYSHGRLQAWHILKAKLRPYNEEALAAAFIPFARHLLSLSEQLEGTNPALLESWQTPGALLDLTPFNVIETTNGPSAIDMEWELPGQIPTGWVLMRSLAQSLTIGITPTDAIQTTLGGLLQAVLRQLDMRYSEHSFQLWAQFEQEFLEVACGVKTVLLTPDLSIARFCPYRKLDLDQPIHQSQQAAPEIDFSYTRWRSMRQILPQEIRRIEQSSAATADTGPRFQIVMRLLEAATTALADTIDALSSQCYPNWRLDVLTTMPAPEGLDEVSCIGWHTLEAPQQAPEALNLLVESHAFDWVIELPAGAIPDPLFLWRLVEDSRLHPDARAFFVDDDCCDSSGQHYNPRFKPGVNPAALQSADLAGPLCVRNEAWLASGGASQRNGSPWFFQLLGVAKQFGWNSIKHIPDVLISYPGTFPSHPESCLLSLLEDIQKRCVGSEIVPTGGESWGIRFPLGAPPRVSVAIVSQGQIDLLTRCLSSVVDKTAYPNFNIIISIAGADNDPDLQQWLTETQQRQLPEISVVRTDDTNGSYAARCNAAVNASTSEFVALLRDESVIIQANWLEELVRTSLQTGIAAVSPRLISPGGSQLQNVGNVFGLNGITGAPYQGKASLGAPGYLDCLLVTRDVSALPAGCMMIKKSAYLAVGGMDADDLGDYLADVDLCQKLRRDDLRLIFQPQATVVYDGSAELTIAGDTEQNIRREQAEFHATRKFLERWRGNATVDPYWNPNLSLAETIPTPEADFRPQWQYLPSAAPRILARPLTNGQGVFRITSPLRALRRANLASECIWNQEGPREPSCAELLRLAPDTVIVQHYLHDRFLASLQAWSELPDRPFVVYAMDDLLTDMAESNPLRRNIPANSWARLKYALARCDRLVTSTQFLADTYRHFIPDIKVVPNRLEQDIWLPLQSRRRVGPRPRIGWAGGSTHQGDLILLKEVIEQTRSEADWIFFGMCPDEIRPLLAEFHPFGDFAEYPARLAALNLDIAVAPLAQIPFNQGKSNLRLLEYGVLGIPVVCTDIEPYRNSPACCVANTVAAWTNALRERIHDADSREKEGNAMRQWVHHSYLIENHLDEWLRAHLPDGK